MTLPNVPIPPSLDSQNFRDAWAEWVEFRKSFAKVGKWDSLFNKHLRMLEGETIPEAIARIDNAIASAYRAPFPIPMRSRPYLDPKNGIVEHTSKHTKMKELELVEAQLKEIRGRASESALEIHYEPADIEPRRLLIARKKQLKAELGYTK